MATVEETEADHQVHGIALAGMPRELARVESRTRNKGCSIKKNRSDSYHAAYEPHHPQRAGLSSTSKKI